MHVCSFKMGEGNGTPLQYSCLENPMDRGAWWAAVHGVSKSWTRLSDFTFMHWRRKWQPAPVFLPGESQGRGAWWAAIYGVAQGRTQLKWLSSSSLSSFGHHKFLWLCVWSCFINKSICISVFRVHMWVILYLSFCIWLTSLCMVISQSLHVAANGIILFLEKEILNVFLFTLAP